MPTMSPIGGLTFIVHAGVNLIILTYKKIVDIFQLPKDNKVSRTFYSLSSEPGTSYKRRSLSYVIILFVFISMSGSILFAIIELINKNANDAINSSKEIADKQLAENLQKLLEKYNQDRAAISTSTNDSKDKIVILLPKDKEVIQHLAYDKYPSLVDFLKSLGTVSTSFDSREELAENLGVLKDNEVYTGSLKQNDLILSELQARLVKYIESNKN